MKKNSTNRRYKDGLFQLLFNDKEKLLELFNVLEGTDYKDASLISIETLEAALYNRMVNDLAFSLGDCYIILAEHQSTANENMPIRMFLYLAREYEKLLDMDELYKKKQYKIPTPHFYVLYNGTGTQSPIVELKLSDAYRKEEDIPMLEMIVKVININAVEQNPILEKCPTLHGYSRFVHLVRESTICGMDRDEAIETAIKACIKEGVLSDFLQKHGAEVTNAMFKEYTIEDMLRIRGEEAAEEGMERGLEQGIAILIDTYKEFGISKEDTKKRIIDKFNLAETAAEDHIYKYWNA